MIKLSIILLAIFLFATTADAGLVSWWKCDETSWTGAANEVVDSYGSNHGTASGATTVPGIDNRAGGFDGTDDYVSILDSNSLDMTTELAMECWFKHSGAWAGTTFLMSKHYTEYEIQFWRDGGGITFWKYLNVAPGYETVNLTYTFTPDVWYHLVLTMNGTAIKLYINSNLVSTQTATYAGVQAGSNNFDIGRRSGSEIEMHKGLIDEVRIYNHALTAAEVAHRYFLGSQTRIR